MLSRKTILHDEMCKKLNSNVELRECLSYVFVLFCLFDLMMVSCKSLASLRFSERLFLLGLSIRKESHVFNYLFWKMNGLKPTAYSMRA